MTRTAFERIAQGLEEARRFARDGTIKAARKEGREMTCTNCKSVKRAEAAERERDEARRERDELKRRIAVGTHCCPDWDFQIVRPDDPESECCTCKPEDAA